MGWWEITFAELPNINNVAIQYELFRLDTVEVCNEFFRMAAISSQVNI
jgi:hypothetical protein